jgi:carbon monoxide dehydrogenase subunit G
MDMSGEYVVPAPRETVWAALNDAEVLKACIPGCEELVKTSDTTMEAKVTQKIGPVKAKFVGAVELVNIDAPAGYTIRGEGKGGVAGFAKGSADVSLSDDPDGTRLVYTAHADVGGKLAQLGGRLINATAKKLADQFFQNFRNHLTTGASAGGT